MGRDIAAVELHALDEFEFGFERRPVLDSDHAVIADPLHGVGEAAADLPVAVGRDGADLRNLDVRGDLRGVVFEFRDDGFDREIDAALQVHGIHAGGHRLGALPDDRMREHDGGGRAVAGLIGGFCCDLAHHLGAHVLELVVEFDFPGDGHAILA